MTHGRLHGLADGIFAIVMTLLVLELKVPAMINATNSDVWHVLKSQSALIIGYFISFTTLFIYWRAHNFIVTYLAKNIDTNLLSINAVFLFFVGLIPFTTQLVGAYNHAPLAISIYAINIILIGLSLVAMRIYIEKSENIDNVERTREQKYGGLIRTMIPLSCALIAIPLSFIATQSAFIILLFGVLINLLNNTADLTRKYVIKPIAGLINFF